MNPLVNCDLAPPTRWSPVRWAIPALLATLLACGLAWRTQALAELERLHHSLAQAERRAAMQQRLREQGQRPVADAGFVNDLNSLADELVFPWEAILDQVTRLAGPEITLDRIQPQMADRKVLLQGHARDAASFLAFLKRLRLRPEWRDVQPVSQEEDRDNAALPLRFALNATWSRP